MSLGGYRDEDEAAYEAEAGLVRQPPSPPTHSGPGVTIGVAGYEVKAARATQHQNPAVLLNILDRNERVFTLLLAPDEATWLAVDLTIAANDSLGIQIPDPRDDDGWVEVDDE